MDYDSIVIGSGAGGLTAALVLARAGERVLVVEQAPSPGGWMHGFDVDGFHFDTGVHYVGQLQPGGRLRRLYEGLGLSADLVFGELRPDAIDHVVVGRDRYALGRGADVIEADLCEAFPGDAAGIREVMDVLTRVASELDRLDQPWNLSPSLVKDLGPLLTWGALPLDRLLARIRDSRARTVLAARCGDHGLPPSRASVGLHAMVMSHYYDGAWYPVGGSQSIVNAYLAALRRVAAEVRTDCPVRSILVDRSGDEPRATGVRLADGTEVHARRVISNADPSVTLGRLLPDDLVSPRLRGRLEQTRWSQTCLSFFGAARFDPAALGLDSGNVWTFDQPSLEPLFEAGVIEAPRFPGTFLTVTSLKDRSRATDGVHTFEAFAFVPWSAFAPWEGSTPGARPEEYTALKDRLRETMVRTLETSLPGLRESLVASAVGTPLSNVSWVAATAGNLYGTEKAIDQLGPLGFRPRSHVHDLYLCGASVGSMGVLGASWSGLRTASIALGQPIDSILEVSGPPIVSIPAEDPKAWAALAARSGRAA